MVNGRRIKLRYAHQGGQNPPIIVVHGNQSAKVPGSYERYLSNYFMKALRLFGTPLRIEFRQGDNPFAKRGRVDKVSSKRGSNKAQRSSQRIAARSSSGKTRAHGKKR